MGRNREACSLPRHPTPAAQVGYTSTHTGTSPAKTGSAHTAANGRPRAAAKSVQHTSPDMPPHPTGEDRKSIACCMTLDFNLHQGFSITRCNVPEEEGEEEEEEDDKDDDDKEEKEEEEDGHHHHSDSDEGDECKSEKDCSNDNDEGEDDDDDQDADDREKQ
ncbi:secreted acidic protein 1A-like [Perca flavescens]|uniref:secreted acidic protein 1A-like n=1 Tax=Perca flavescens TaxID=8167 RepID=UPI00106E23EC|nr:secreted acidic protein 1A-like [Perca flavescens]